MLHFFRLLRYGGIGIAVSMLYSGLVFAAVEFFGVRSPTLASSIAFILVLPVSFFAHRKLSFHDAARDTRQSYRFAAVAIASFIVAVGGMQVMTETMNLHYAFGIIVAWVLVPVANFAINSLWVFPLPPSESTIKTEAGNRLHRE